MQQAISIFETISTFRWVVSPIGATALLGLCGFVLTGIPGRIILRVETYLACRETRRRTAADDEPAAPISVTYLRQVA